MSGNNSGGGSSWLTQAPTQPVLASTTPKPVLNRGPALPLMAPPVVRAKPRPTPTAAPKPFLQASSSSSILTPEPGRALMPPPPAGASHLAPGEDSFGEVVDPYDPMKPNDYMEYCQERIKRKEEEERAKEMNRFLEEQEKERKRMAEMRQRLVQAVQEGGVGSSSSSPSEVVAAAVAGAASAGLGRGRGRGISNLPAWMIGAGFKKGDEGVTTITSSQAVEAPGGPLAATSPASQQFADAEGGEAARSNVGQRLLAKLGYKEGAGLGKEEQGITRAIQHRSLGGGQGKVVMPPPQTATSAAPPMAPPPSGGETAAASSRKKKRGLFSNPTRILLLKNMVAPGEVDDELESETKEECDKYGPVRQCVVLEVKETSVPEEEKVRIFVAFETQESAVKAYLSLNGRFFGGRQIAASFYDEERFNRRDLAPSPGEME